MDLRTGEIMKEIEWRDKLGDIEFEYRVRQGRMITGRKPKLELVKKIKRLRMGTKNQKKKARQLMRDNY